MLFLREEYKQKSEEAKTFALFLTNSWNVFRLEVTFDKAEENADALEKNYKLLDEWKQRSDELLYDMIPKTVADRLRVGDSALSTCEVSICNGHMPGVSQGLPLGPIRFSLIGHSPHNICLHYRHLIL